MAKEEFVGEGTGVQQIVSLSRKEAADVIVRLTHLLSGEPVTYMMSGACPDITITEFGSRVHRILLILEEKPL